MHVGKGYLSLQLFSSLEFTIFLTLSFTQLLSLFKNYFNYRNETNIKLCIKNSLLIETKLLSSQEAILLNLKQNRVKIYLFFPSYEIIQNGLFPGFISSKSIIFHRLSTFLVIYSNIYKYIHIQGVTKSSNWLNISRNTPQIEK